MRQGTDNTKQNTIIHLDSPSLPKQNSALLDYFWKSHVLWKYAISYKGCYKLGLTLYHGRGKLICVLAIFSESTHSQQ